MAKYRINLNLTGAEAAIRRKLVIGLSRAVSAIEARVIKSLRQKLNRDGRTPSLPGQPPAERSGDLATKSIGTSVDPITLTASIGTIAGSPGSIYGKMLEFGTSRMAERPFLRPAVFNHKASIIKDLNRG